MPRTCTVCAHPSRADIDAALLAGKSYRDIARQFWVSRSALQRHRGHLPAALAEAKAAEEAARAHDLLAELKVLRTDAKRIQQRAEKSDNLTAALAAIREQSRIIELLLRVAGELAEGATVNVLVSPQWLTVRSVLLAALGPYPEARAAVASRLLELEAGDGHSN